MTAKPWPGTLPDRTNPAIVHYTLHIKRVRYAFDESDGGDTIMTDTGTVYVRRFSCLPQDAERCAQGFVTLYWDVTHTWGRRIDWDYTEDAPAPDPETVCEPVSAVDATPRSVAELAAELVLALTAKWEGMCTVECEAFKMLSNLLFHYRMVKIHKPRCGKKHEEIAREVAE